jgi:Asp-tRNA(Asn)/Glu-tRNA(Gln) amidotransferase A subunit family amidase
LSVTEQWTYVAKREAFRATWHAWWNEPSNSYDFLLTPPNATPAVPHNGMKKAVSSCGYTLLFNLLDYTCGIVPVTHVDRAKDALSDDFKKSLGKMNGVARGAYALYDAEKMHGLPVAVQVVGRRLEEEKVLSYMKVVEDALEKRGWKYALLEVD